MRLPKFGSRAGAAAHRHGGPGVIPGHATTSTIRLVECNMLYNNRDPQRQLLLPRAAGPAPDRLPLTAAAAARPRGRGGCYGQFQPECRDQIITSAAAFAVPLCAGAPHRDARWEAPGARRAAGPAEWSIARLPPACSSGGRATGITADSH